MTADDVKFGQDGLVPAIVQDFYSGRVLMAAYMNRESLEITIREKRTCFYSRSRQTLWRKGETSGNVQRLISLAADCDGDALLVKVAQSGPACHTGEASCFFNSLFEGEEKDEFSLGALYALIAGRKIRPQEGSYTTYLFSKGKEKILKKVGEESTEVVIAAMKGDRAETVFEVSDLCYHILVLMAECGITPGEVIKELSARHVVDKKVKQETMR